MSFKYGFYNAINHDRLYDADDISKMFDGLITDGVFETIDNALFTVPNTGLMVTVKTGKAWFDHTWNILDSDLPLNIDSAHLIYTRIDAVVLEVNLDSRTNSIKVITGTPSADPARPLLTQYQHPLAYVTIPANASSITSANIQIMVGSSECPFVTGILTSLDISTLFNRWEDQFDTWFGHLVDELTTQQATNLQRQIDEINAHLDNIGGVVIGTTPPTIPGSENKLWVDLTPITGGLKYWNSTAWAHVPVAYT